jgi:hypothetical protein
MPRDYEEEEIEEGEITTEESYTPPSKEEVRWMYNYNELYKQIKLSLLGLREEYDKKTGTWKIVRETEPFLPEKAVSEILTLIKGYVNIITGLTYLSEERVLQLCYFIYLDLAQFLLLKRKEYQLTPEKASQVLNIIISIFEANLRKSIGGFGMRILGVMERVIEHKVGMEPKRKLWPF